MTRKLVCTSVLHTFLPLWYKVDSRWDFRKQAFGQSLPDVFRRYRSGWANRPGSHLICGGYRGNRAAGGTTDGGGLGSGVC